MEKYDYRKAVKNDVKMYLDNQVEWRDFKGCDISYVFSNLMDDIHLDYAVTGSAAGSYTCNNPTTEEYLNGNGDLLKEVFEMDGYSLEDIADNGLDFCDMAIRRYLLPDVLMGLLYDYEDKFIEE